MENGARWQRNVAGRADIRKWFAVERAGGALWHCRPCEAPLDHRMKPITPSPLRLMGDRDDCDNDRDDDPRGPR